MRLGAEGLKDRAKWGRGGIRPSKIWDEKK